MLRKIFSTIIITSLLSSSIAMGQSDIQAEMSATPANPVSSTVSETFTKALDSSLTRQILKPMGEPGYYASRLLSLRKHINQEPCTNSESIARVATITAILGDLTTHAYDFFEGKRLEQKFSDKLDKIHKYEEELKANNQKVLDYQGGDSVNLQLDALKFLKEQAEIELKRAKMVQVVAYVTTGLNVTSQLLAFQEAAAEAVSLGSTLAATKACQARIQPKQKNTETSTERALKGVTEPLPWYLLPFYYLAKGIVAIEKTDTYKTYKSYTRGLDKDEMRDKLKSDGSVPAGSENQIAESAAYTEEMLFRLVKDVLNRLQTGKKDVTEEINNFNKSTQETSGIMKFIKGLRLDDMAIRYAIRTLIQTHLVQVEAFRTSAVGRAILYAHNIYIVYRTIEVNKSQVAFAEQKIAILDKTIKEFEAKTTWTPLFNQFLDSILPRAVAALPPVSHFPRPPCVQEIVPGCNLKNFDFMASADIKKYYGGLPKDVQSAQQNVLTNNYSLKVGLNLATGNMSYEDIDVEKIQNETKMLETMAKSLEKELTVKSKDFAAYYAPALDKMNKEVFFPESILAAAKDDAPNTSTLSLDSPLLASVLKGKMDEVKGEKIMAESVNPGVPVVKDTPDLQAAKDVSYNLDHVETISTKESNLFEIITNRYIQIYRRNDLVQ